MGFDPLDVKPFGADIHITELMFVDDRADTRSSTAKMLKLTSVRASPRFDARTGVAQRPRDHLNPQPCLNCLLLLLLLIEYEYRGSPVTGKLVKKSPRSSNSHPIWIVTPSDRRRRNEEVPEKALGKIIDEDKAMSNRGHKLKTSATTTSSSNSDDSPDQPKRAKKPKQKSSSSGSGKGSPSSEGNSKTSRSAAGKRRGDAADVGGAGGKARRIHHKSVKFPQTPAVAAIISKQRKTKRVNRRAKETTRIGTRSTSGPVAGSAAMELLPDHPVKRKSPSKGKKAKRDDKTVKVVKMLTGTLYLHRGDRPRAEFVRTKWN